MDARNVWQLVKETFAKWREERTALLAAALAFYAVLSLVPSLILAGIIASMILGQPAAEGRLVGQIQDLVGEEAARAVQTMIQSLQEAGSGVPIIGIVALLFGTSRVFAHLETALNMIWDVAKQADQGIAGYIADRILAVVIALGVVFLLLLSLVVGTSFAVFGNALANLLPGPAALLALRIGNYLIVFIIFTLLFAIIYKTLPDATIPWSDVWVGTAVTSLLFTIGQVLIGVYFSVSRLGVAAGVAGATLILLIWVYYSAHIVLLGAVFTEVYAEKYGSKIKADQDGGPLAEKLGSLGG